MVLFIISYTPKEDVSDISSGAQWQQEFRYRATVKEKTGFFCNERTECFSKIFKANHLMDFISIFLYSSCPLQMMKKTIINSSDILLFLEHLIVHFL